MNEIKSLTAVLMQLAVWKILLFDFNKCMQHHTTCRNNKYLFKLMLMSIFKHLAQLQRFIKTLIVK